MDNSAEISIPAAALVVGVWDDYECWKCAKKTRIIEWSWENGQEAMWTEDDKIGQRLQAVFPFYKKDYTKTADTYYYCNHCTNCGTIQGDWFVTDWVARQRAEGRLPSDASKLQMDQS